MSIPNTIADELRAVATNVPKVYEAGAKDYIKNAECLNGVVKGNNLTITDITDFEHLVTVETELQMLTDKTKSSALVTGNVASFYGIYAEWAEEEGKYPNRGLITANKNSVSGYVSAAITFHSFTIEPGEYKFIAEVEGAPLSVYTILKDNKGNETRYSNNRAFTVNEECQCFIRAYCSPNKTSETPLKTYITTKLITKPKEPIKILVMDEKGETFEYLTDSKGIANVRSTYPTMSIMAELEEAILTVKYIKDATKIYDEAYEAGKRREYDAFWDAFQVNGTREPYSRAFASVGWNNDNFKPKYDIVCVGKCEYMFGYTKYLKGSLVDILNEQGVILDTSKATDLNTAFTGMREITELPTIDLSSCGKMVDNLFNDDVKLKTIEKIVFSGQVVDTMFTKCSSLIHFGVGGVIKTSGLNLQWSTKLDKETITDLIDILDKGKSGCSVTFSQTAVNAAFTSEEWAELIATKPTWTINLV